MRGKGGFLPGCYSSAKLLRELHRVEMKVVGGETSAGRRALPATADSPRFLTNLLEAFEWPGKEGGGRVVPCLSWMAKKCSWRWPCFGQVRQTIFRWEGWHPPGVRDQKPRVPWQGRARQRHTPLFYRKADPWSILQNQAGVGGDRGKSSYPSGRLGTMNDLTFSELL